MAGVLNSCLADGELTTTHATEFCVLGVDSAAERTCYGEKGSSTTIAELVASGVSGTTFTAVSNIRLT